MSDIKMFKSKFFQLIVSLPVLNLPYFLPQIQAFDKAYLLWFQMNKHKFYWYK